MDILRLNCIAVFVPWILLATYVSPENTGLIERCQLEKFTADCGRDTVIVIEEAMFGRMHLGRCVEVDYGHVGCRTDALPEVDRKCSGRHTCSFTVSDLQSLRPCPKELAPFLEARYSCLNVIQPEPTTICSVGHPGLDVTATEGYLANVFANQDNGGFGSQACPWKIMVEPGQQINITVMNFARVPDPTPKAEDETLNENSPGGLEDLRRCYQLATIRDGNTERKLTECEGSPRINKGYISTSSVITISMISSAFHEVYFLLHFKAVGCANPKLPKATWLRRDEESAYIRCNFTEETWFLTCSEGRWVGQIGNCTDTSGPSGSIFSAGADFPYGILIVVAIGVALGVFFGGILLTLASFYLKRKRLRSALQAETPEQRIYEFSDRDKQVAEFVQQPGCRYHVHPNNQPGGAMQIIDPRMKDGAMTMQEPPYQQYGQTFNDGVQVEFRRGTASPGCHIYESPKFARKM